MRPSFPIMDKADIGHADRKSCGDISLSNSRRAKLSYGQNIGLIQFAKTVTLASIGSPVADLIGHVFTSSSVNKVLGRDASAHPFPAGMPDLMFRGRGRPINSLANDRMNRRSAALKIDRSVTIAVGVVRPDETFWASMLKDNVFEIFKMFARRALKRLKRVAFCFPSVVVPNTPSTRVDSLAAVKDGAYTGFSHLSLSSGSDRLERVAMFQHPARSLFVSMSRVTVQ